MPLYPSFTYAYVYIYIYDIVYSTCRRQTPRSTITHSLVSLVTQVKTVACCFQRILISGWDIHKFNRDVFYWRNLIFIRDQKPHPIWTSMLYKYVVCLLTHDVGSWHMLPKLVGANKFAASSAPLCGTAAEPAKSCGLKTSSDRHGGSGRTSDRSPHLVWVSTGRLKGNRWGSRMASWLKKGPKCKFNRTFNVIVMIFKLRAWQHGPNVWSLVAALPPVKWQQIQTSKIWRTQLSFSASAFLVAYSCESTKRIQASAATCPFCPCPCPCQARELSRCPFCSLDPL